MNRPSRGARASATTKRYVGCFFAPMRRSRILTMYFLIDSAAWHRRSGVSSSDAPDRTV